MTERELIEEMRCKEGNALYIGPRNGDNETMPSIQRMTHGDTVEKRNRRNIVSETTHTT